MDAVEAILSRRSIRKYTDGKIPEELVTELLEAAMAAPSANNQQPWQFIVIDDRALLDAIPEFHPYSQMLTDAPLAILVCIDQEHETMAEGYAVQDCAAATENVLLAAHGKGLGAVWLGIHPVAERVEGIGKLVGLPDHVRPFSLISIGYPAEEKGPSERYDAARVHRNGW